MMNDFKILTSKEEYCAIYVNLLNKLSEHCENCPECYASLTVNLKVMDRFLKELNKDD